MRKVLVIGILILAIGSGGAASILTYRMLKNRQASAMDAGSKAAPTFPLVVATTQLAYGTVLQAEHVKTIEWASTIRPEGSFSDPGAVVGRAIMEGVVPGEPILEGRLAPKDAGGGLASVIPKGKRAVSVRVNEIIGVAGFVLPRTRVDVVVSVNPGGEKGKSASKMILQNVEVLAAGQKIEQDEEGKPETVNVITLLVSPEDAEKLTLASHEGDLQLALRNSLDL
ncbi:MAG TPA: Flp pilus assembly protein CpaB, partial [Candidatus Polarisedimenticolia bacterium]|nr:Flp pilus assembly protein CpaB [Candidatus Polarisedimenticolia bacterium]